MSQCYCPLVKKEELRGNIHLHCGGEITQVPTEQPKKRNKKPSKEGIVSMEREND